MKKIYLVGGAVRDLLLGRKPNDRDYVLVGYTEKEMLDEGYKRVGNSFPVFLHPVMGDEYALARREKKVVGEDSHTAFECETQDVTLEEDLQRRDLTINALAIPRPKMDQGFVKELVIDPYDGLDDIKNKVLRHVSPAFAEDPLRVLRVAKFAARFPDFTIAPETIELMKALVNTNGFKELSTERVYKEMSAALKYETPSIFFNVLKEVGGLEHFFPEIHKLIDVPQRPEYHPEGDCYIHTMLVLDHAAKVDSKYRDEIVFAALLHDLGKGITPVELLPAHHDHEHSGVPLVEKFCERFLVSRQLKSAALTVTRHHLRVHRISEANPKSAVRMFYEINAFRAPHLIEILARACECDDLGKNMKEVLQGKLLEEYFNHVKDVGVLDVRPRLVGKAVGEKIREIRVKKLKYLISSKKRALDENNGRTL
jgi:tRNA nucleotidyltransferase (CCA-adding enzyme)